jgi:hypothetical protein
MNCVLHFNPFARDTEFDPWPPPGPEPTTDVLTCCLAWACSACCLACLHDIRERMDPSSSSISRYFLRLSSLSEIHLVHARRPRRLGRGGSAFRSDEVLEMGDEVIAVAIPHLDKVAVFVVDALDGCGRGFEVERPSVPHRHPCQIYPLLVAFCNHGFDLISGLEAMDRFGPHEVTSREALLGKPGALVCAAAIRGDVQGGLFQARDLNHRIHVADRDRIKGVCFRDEEAMAVELGASAGADRDRQTEQLQCTIERPPGGIDGSGVLERLFCLLKDAL